LKTLVIGALLVMGRNLALVLNAGSGARSSGSGARSA
jgi:hypothetical protein